MKNQQDILIEDFQTINPELVQAFTNTTIVITGASGFIGSLLARYFLWANKKYNLQLHLILCIRNPSKLETIIPGATANPAISIHTVDFLHPTQPLDTPFDYLIHTAAITTSSLMVAHPTSVIDITLNGTRWALESCTTHPHARMLYLSSMEVYGSFTDGRIVDESQLGTIDLTSVRSCYPESKRTAELLCTLYNSEKHTDACIARLAQTFGAGILPEETRVFKQFATSALTNTPITLHTDGLSEGNYVYSADAVSAILTLLIKGETGNAYNIANEACHTTIRNMAQLVIDTFNQGGLKLIIENHDSAKYGYAAPTKMTLSSEKLRSLGWSPTTDLTQAYQKLINFIQAEQ